MAPIRILVVDDSAVIRKVLSDTLAEDRALKVVGVASDGRIALDRIPLLKPDLITLDVEMPVMDGLETLALVRKSYPQLKSSCSARSPSAERRRPWMRWRSERRTMPQNRPIPTVPQLPSSTSASN